MRQTRGRAASRGVAGDAAPALNNLRDPVGGHLDLARQFGRRDANFLQFVGENFAG
jgi:hypothetical protein